MFKKQRVVRRSTLTLTRFLLLLVTVGVCIGIHTFTRPDAVKEAADVPMQGVFADTPENLQVAQTQPAQEPSISEVEVEVPILPEASGLYALVAKDITGQFQDLRLYAGSVTVVVNVASQWGYTISNYQGLEELYGRYKDQGLVVMGFPSNQFGNQEPEDEAAISTFVVDTFGVSFPMFSKVEVNGLNTHPVYEFIKGQGPEFAADVEWNFVKFVVDRNGDVVKRLPSPFDRVELEAVIERLLAQN